MPKDTITEIKAILKNSDKLNFSDTENLSDLLDQLQAELESLPQEKKAQAIEIADLVKQRIQVSKLQDPKETDFSDLEQAIIEYEASHPRVTHAVRSICNLLSSIGI